MLLKGNYLSATPTFVLVEFFDNCEKGAGARLRRQGQVPFTQKYPVLMPPTAKNQHHPKLCPCRMRIPELRGPVREHAAPPIKEKNENDQ